MPRSKRAKISRDAGLMHISSRVAGGGLLFGDREKEYFLRLLERFAGGFYLKIHRFAIMSNHFHLLVSEGSQDAACASKESLFDRYHLLYGRESEPPIGRQEADGSFVPDADGGVERLRRRLGSVSSFVQELKQQYSHWYNVSHQRKGYLWGNRFHGQLVEIGDAMLVSSAYIDLNPVRAGMVAVPEAYRWSSLGLLVRNPLRARRFLSPLPVQTNRVSLDESAYRQFVYRSGKLPVRGKASISPLMAAEVEALCGRLGIMDLVKYRVRNLTEGLALGSREFVAGVMIQLNPKPRKQRLLAKGTNLFCSRVLSSP